MPAELQTERRDNALILTISDPGSHSLLSRQVFTAGVESLSVAESDADIQCILLRGEGAHFCADVNLPLWSETPEAAADMRRHFQDFAEALRVFPKPVIAVVEGMACGDGFWLALACDLIVAARDAEFLPFPTRAGLEHGPGGLAAEPMHALPRSLLLEWMWLGDPVPAARLHQLGYVNQLADRGQALQQALALAGRLASIGSSAHLALAKEHVNHDRLAVRPGFQ